MDPERILDQITYYQNKAAELQVLYDAKVAVVNKYGEDKFPEKTVLYFEKEEDGQINTYAMIKLSDIWFATGINSYEGCTWDELRTWMAGGTPVDNLYIMKIDSKVTIQ